MVRQRIIAAAVCSELFTARPAPRAQRVPGHLFGAFVVAPQIALAITDAFLGAEFEGGVYQDRFDITTGIEDEEARRRR